jgi:hypothetical protein
MGFKKPEFYADFQCARLPEGQNAPKTNFGRKTVFKPLPLF